MFKYKLIGDNDYIFDIQGTILKNRGIEDVDKFLNLDKSVENSYKTLKNIDKAVECLEKHIENESKILIVVDPDVDGYTSASIMYQYLKMMDDKLNIQWVLHEDKTHGLKNIEVPNDIQLIIVPDASSNDFEIHKKLSEKGIDIIVLDHHELKKESEHAIVVNPQLGGYNNLNLSGAGIVYKFCQALDDLYWLDYADYFLDLVALGNIADSMSMAELETRYYVQKGLSEINNDFFRALLRQQEFSTKGKVNITTVGFYIAPLINAVIRIGDKKDKIDMFKSFIGIRELVKYKPRGSDEILVPLIDDMARRCVNIKNKQNRMVDKIVAKIEEKIDDENLNENKVIFIHDIDDLDGGLTGLIANKIASKYKKPAIILSGINEKGNYKGSARGYDKGELKDFRSIALQTKLFELAEGHLNAFGIEINKNNLEKINTVFNELLNEYSFEDIYYVDFVIPAKSNNHSIIKSICELDDLWGKDVEEPYILIKNIPIKESDVLLLGKNKDTVSINYNNINYVMFKTNQEMYEKIRNSTEITVVGRANINEYKGNTYYQIVIDDIIMN
ncbi:RecJ-like ssDNA exonuclease [Geobacillus virus E3]|uniref:RecJ-like ssDNA exonuclease n=1 Tax=Geobacillus virus E3 TaxID=1572712 RepID=UPI000671ACEB|nr:RecJ-like ssDNA exonuclease [Geobacillus virus E3]AJA41416.1 putative single stranded DNA exonuclease [Geobacillus virus E3]